MIDHFLFSLKSVTRRKLRSWLTLIGILIGIAAVVSLITLAQGLKSAISDEFLKVGSDKIVITGINNGFGPPGSGSVTPVTKHDAKLIRKITGVDIVTGRLIDSAQLTFHKNIKYGNIISIPSDKTERDLVVEARGYDLSEGRMLKNDDSNKIVIGNGMSKDYFDKKIKLNDKIEIMGESFEIVGILNKLGIPTEDNVILMNEDKQRYLFEHGDNYNLIIVKATNIEDIDSISNEIERKMLNDRNLDEGKEDFSIQTPEQIINTLNEILLVIQVVLVGIAAISLGVGSIGIMNTMYTSVLEKTKEIGILKSIGAKRSDILIIFLFESGLLGFVGGLLGVTLGFIIAKSVEIGSAYYFESTLIKANFNPILIVSVLIFSIIIGIISGVLPARQATKLQAVDALRK